MQQIKLNNILSITATIFLMVFSVSTALAGPYPVNDFIDMNDAGIAAWATGYQNYNVGSNVDDKWQTPNLALGKAVGTSFDIVSLGRGGTITMTFGAPIINGSGADFAIFENSFSTTFLELAYVEVSSNGIDFVRFDNNSLTQNPVGGFGSVDASNLYQLAGKHKQGLGTLFDLDWLQYNSPTLRDNPAILDLNNINYIKLLDIVGDGTYDDTFGSVIYDPYPTVGSAGFDLDAIGVLNQGSSVPVPGAIWLFVSGLIGLAGLKRRKTT